MVNRGKDDISIADKLMIVNECNNVFKEIVGSI